jgi:hypothetical protein
MRGGNEHEGGGYSVAAARVASILPRLPEELPPSGGGLQAYREPQRRAPYGAESSVF